MSTDASLGRQLDAVFDFWGMPREVERTAPLGPGEVVMLEASVGCRRRFGLQRRAWLRLTSERLVLLEHHVFLSDRVLEAPPAAVSLADDRTTVALRVQTGDGEVVRHLARWKGLPPMLGPKLRPDTADLLDVLSRWSLDAGGDLRQPDPR